MNKVLKLQRVGLNTPTVVEYEGKVLATNHLDIESTCNLWRVHFGFYPTEKVDIAMTKKQFSSIQQKTLSSVKSVYELFYERNFIPRVFEANEEHTEWGMYRNKELEKLEAENAELKARLRIIKMALEYSCLETVQGNEQFFDEMQKKVNKYIKQAEDVFNSEKNGITFTFAESRLKEL